MGNSDWMYPNFQVQVSLENASYNIDICRSYTMAR